MKQLLFLLFFVPVWLPAQQVEVKDLTQQNGRQYYKGKPFTGTAVMLSSQNKIGLVKGAYKDYYVKEKHTFKKGELVQKQELTANKEVLVNAHYKNNQLHGNYTERYNKMLGKQTKAAGKFLNGKKHGLWKYYHRNGVPSAVGHYEHGQKTGKWVYKYKDGTVNYEGEIKKLSPEKREQLEKFAWPLLFLK